MKKFEGDESLIVTTFELDQPKLHLFLEILNKMFLLEQKIKAFREVLVQFNKDSIECGQSKADLLELFETKVKEFQDNIKKEAEELKKRHVEYQKMKTMSVDIAKTIDDISMTLKPDPNNPQSIVIKAKISEDGSFFGCQGV